MFPQRPSAGAPASSAATPRLLAGVVGPVAFTAAWAWSGRGQPDYSVGFEHISGLAAPDADRPLVMVAGFTVLGCNATVFATALEDALGGRGRAGLGPTLLRVGGVSAVVAGLLRRDRMLLDPPGGPLPHSWHNDAHDAASAAAYASLVAAPLALARRFRGDPRWWGLHWPAVATSTTTGALLALFASRAVEPHNGVIQRVAVTIPCAGMLALACRLLVERSRVGHPGGRPGG